MSEKDINLSVDQLLERNTNLQCAVRILIGRLQELNDRKGLDMWDEYRSEDSNTFIKREKK